MGKITKLPFKPLWGITSKHLQMILANFWPIGRPPPSHEQLIDIGNGDQLACAISTPKNFTKTIVLIHGLGGDQTARYMVRLARKFYAKGFKVVRVNLRNCGPGKGLSKLPYNSGTSGDILHVVQYLKKTSPHSDITVIGFSLGGNIALKLAGELHKNDLLEHVIAVCPPLDLDSCVGRIQSPENKFYHYYYLKNLLAQSLPWVKEKIDSIYAYDDKVIGPLWGYGNAKNYYRQCSSIFFLNKIHTPTDILVTVDDPFMSFDLLQGLQIPDPVHIWFTEHGSHMGFLGYTEEGDYQWVDSQIMKWIE